MPEAAAFAAELSRIAQAPVLADYPLVQECTFKLGGPARFFCAPASPAAMQACRHLAYSAGMRVFILGGGSNVLFKDEGFPGLVLSTKGLRGISFRPDHSVLLESGVTNADLTRETLVRNLTGFEWASGLPGTIGGGVCMNAKCYGHSFSDSVLAVTALRPDGAEVRLGRQECGFAYKHSIFQQPGYIITSVHLQLTPGDPESIRAKTQENLADRKRKGQFLFPSAGCVFKNDYGVGTSSGRVIEDSGLKGRQVGGVRVFEQHCNFIVNAGGGKAQDVLELIQTIKAEVLAKKGICLEEELRVVD